MTDKKVAQEAISKALESLLEVAKGHASRGTATTAVESMRDSGAGAGSGAGSTQVYHTPSNSDPKGWAGSSAKDCPEDGATDDIEEDGTDYKGVSHGLMKSILDKIEKGEALSEAEAFVFKSIVSKAGYAADPKEEKVDKGKPPFLKDDDKDDKDDKDVGKSLTDHASDNEEVTKGFEMSSFLAGWAHVQNEALQSAESRIVESVNKSLSALDADNSKFQVELAKSIGALAEVLSLQGQRVEQLETTPARGPKSAQAVEKSFGAGGEPQGEQLQKSQVLDAMIDMVHKSLIPAQEVVKFESTGELREELYQAVVAHRQAR
jgi:hypothetical protein